MSIIIRLSQERDRRRMMEMRGGMYSASILVAYATLRHRRDVKCQLLECFSNKKKTSGVISLRLRFEMPERSSDYSRSIRDFFHGRQKSLEDLQELQIHGACNFNSCLTSLEFLCHVPRLYPRLTQLTLDMTHLSTPKHVIQYLRQSESLRDLTLSIHSSAAVPILMHLPHRLQSLRLLSGGKLEIDALTRYLASSETKLEKLELQSIQVTHADGLLHTLVATPSLHTLTLIKCCRALEQAFFGARPTSLKRLYLELSPKPPQSQKGHANKDEEEETDDAYDDQLSSLMENISKTSVELLDFGSWDMDESLVRTLALSLAHGILLCSRGTTSLKTLRLPPIQQCRMRRSQSRWNISLAGNNTEDISNRVNDIDSAIDEFWVLEPMLQALIDVKDQFTLEELALTWHERLSRYLPHLPVRKLEIRSSPSLQSYRLRPPSNSSSTRKPWWESVQYNMTITSMNYADIPIPPICQRNRTLQHLLSTTLYSSDDSMAIWAHVLARVQVDVVYKLLQQHHSLFCQ